MLLSCAISHWRGVGRHVNIDCGASVGATADDDDAAAVDEDGDDDDDNGQIDDYGGASNGVLKDDHIGDIDKDDVIIHGYADGG